MDTNKLQSECLVMNWLNSPLIFEGITARHGAFEFLSRQFGFQLKLLNFFLSALSPPDLAALSPGLVEVVLDRSEVLFEPGEAPDTIYFPGGACVSIVTILADGRIVESASVGRESAVGLLEAITGRPATVRAFAQVGGSAMRLAASLFRSQMLQSPTLAQLTLLHVRANSVQAEQGVACNAAHDVPERLARWLLMTQDRVGSTSFPLTQDYMAVMTGVQRSTVSLAASGLKQRRLIDYSRGQVTILDRAGLQRQACECYGIIGSQFESLRVTADG
jgi:CRP-like cAMP-binding protein